jgi:hypothetical protein
MEIYSQVMDSRLRGNDEKRELRWHLKGPQNTDQLGQIDPEDHQGDEDGRRREAEARARGC